MPISALALLGTLVEGTGDVAAACFVALLLSFVLIGIASLIEAVNMNTRRREEKK